MQNYAQIWTEVMTITARLQMIPEMTVGEYFRGAKPKNAAEARVMKSWGREALHDLLIKVERGQISAMDFTHLSLIDLQPKNYLILLRFIYTSAMAGDAS